MQKTTKRTPFEQAITAGLKEEPLEWTSDCLDPEDLLRIVDLGEKHPQTAPLMPHLLACDTCRREYIETRAALLEAKSAKNVSVRTERATPSLLTHWKERLVLPAVGAALGAMAMFLIAFWTTILPLKQGVSKQAGLRQEVMRQKQEAEARLAITNQELAESRLKAARAETALKGVQTAAARREQSQFFVKMVQDAAVPLKDYTYARGKTAGPGSTSTGLIHLHAPYAIIPQDLPTFRWEPVPGAHDYSLTVAEDTPQTPVVFKKERLKAAATECTPSHPFKRGRTYIWEVRAFALSHGSLQPKEIAQGGAKFRVLDEKVLHKTTPISALHLKLGDAYARVQRIEEAASEYGAVLPGQPNYAVAQARLRALHRFPPSPAPNGSR